MPLLVRAFPVIQGKEETMRFIEELTQRRKSDAEAFYQRLGVSRETVFWQDTSHGPLIIVSTEVADLTETPKAFAMAEEPFESWFKQEILRLSGVDLNQTPLGPPSEKIFEWVAKEKQNGVTEKRIPSVEE
jgi:hypothetical protein